MEKLEKVELVREKCNVSYEKAREALEACDYEVLDAIIYLETAQKPVEPTARLEEPVTAPEPEVAYEEAASYETDTEDSSDSTAGEMKSKIRKAWESFRVRLKELEYSGMHNHFVAERNGERVLAIPVLILILGMFFWGATLWLLVIGLFFGFRYHVEGLGTFTVDVNDAMDKAADAADNIKQNFA